MSICENCGEKIGPLETPCKWNGHAVCYDCKKRLARPEPDSFHEWLDFLWKSFLKAVFIAILTGIAFRLALGIH
jgi:hypothetical protein